MWGRKVSAITGHGPFNFMTTLWTPLMDQLQLATGVTLEQHKTPGTFSPNVRPSQLLDKRSLRIMNLRIFQGSQIINWADLYLNPIIVGSHMMMNQKNQDRLASGNLILDGFPG